MSVSAGLLHRVLVSFNPSSCSIEVRPIWTGIPGRNHDRPDTDRAVQPGQGVHPVHHALTRAQRPPQLIKDHEVVPARFQAGVCQGVGDVDRSEAVGPAREQPGGPQVRLGLVDAGDIEDHGPGHVSWGWWSAGFQ